MILSCIAQLALKRKLSRLSCFCTNWYFLILNVALNVEQDLVEVAISSVLVQSPVEDLDIWNHHISEEIVEEVEEEKITPILDLTDVQQPPYFPGGESALYSYISQNFTWPSRDIEEGNEGRVFVQFVVDQNGEVTDVKVARGINERLNQEAIRVIKGMPRWSPGKNGGVPVKVRYMIPVVLKLK